MKTVPIDGLDHYTAPDRDGPFYVYSVCGRILQRALHEYYEGRPATCLWCVGRRYVTTDVGF